MWYYLEGNEKKGPLSEEELKGLILKKAISNQTNVWKEGMNSWKKASECDELNDSPPPLPPAIPKPPTMNQNFQQSSIHNQEPSLWNTNAASLWSLLFSPIFGGIIVFKNWQSLGNEKKAKVSLGWVMGCALFAFVNLFLDMPMKIGYGVLLLWYFIDCRPQIQFIKTNLQEKYLKKSWNKPLVFAAIGLGIYIILITLVLGFQDDPAELVRTGHLGAYGDSVTVGEVFDVVSAGEVEWVSGDLEESDSQAKTHDLVEATWQNQAGATVVIQFLVPKDGESFELHGATIGENFIEAEQCINGIGSLYHEMLQENKPSNQPSQSSTNTASNAQYGPCEQKIQELDDLINKGICVGATAYYMEEESFSKIYSMYMLEQEFSLELPDDEWSFNMVQGTQQIGLSIAYKKPTPECINGLTIDGILKPNKSGIVEFEMISTSHEKLVKRVLK